jgi:hypothetical protein
MGQVVDFERERVEALARKLVPLFEERGTIALATVDVDVVERWRRAARRAGRLLGSHMRTGVTDDGALVWAGSEDFPVTDELQREAVERVAALVRYGDPHAERRL